jgi:HxlR-like helix-turn-helix
MRRGWSRTAQRLEIELRRASGQCCAVERGAEVFAERWTPIIMRNILYGCRTFNEIAAGAPGLSRARLTRRLRELERAGIIKILAKRNDRGIALRAQRGGARARVGHQRARRLG